MDFEWDDTKNTLNLAKHDIDFVDAVQVFLDDKRIEREDNRKDYNESRFQTIGITELGIVFVIYTERNSGGTIRIISARKANSRERKSYDKGFLKPYAKVI